MPDGQFGLKLREIRDARGLTQAELAELAGLTRVGLAQLEIGRRSPSWETVVALADALAISADYFRKPPKRSSAKPVRKT